MYLLGIDLETTGLDTQNDRVLEIGYVVWEQLEAKPITVTSALIGQKGDTIPEESREITGITDAYTNDFGKDLKGVLEDFVTVAKKCSYFVGHNVVGFDKPFLERLCKNQGINLPSIPWIDTMTDIVYPTRIKTRKLHYLATEHEIPTTDMHRASFDALASLRLLSKYNFNAVVRRSQSKSMVVVANVSFEEKDLAKLAGFRWDSTEKIWLKRIKECDFDDSEWRFDVTVKVDDDEVR